jgi:ElaA protein
MTNAPTIRFAPFAGLTALEFHDVLKLRFDVFVLEQQSLYPEIDGNDPEALHMFVEDGGAVIGTARLLGMGGVGPVTIGRVAITRDRRGSGLGQTMVEAALAYLHEHAPGRHITLGAQLHLEDFYSAFGFKRISGVYDDGGIPHVDMTRPTDMVER